MRFSCRVLLVGLTVSLLGAGAAACTGGTDNGGVIQGPATTAGSTTVTTAAGTPATHGTLGPPG